MPHFLSAFLRPAVLLGSFFIWRLLPFVSPHSDKASAPADRSGYAPAPPIVKLMRNVKCQPEVSLRQTVRRGARIHTHREKEGYEWSRFSKQQLSSGSKEPKPMMRPLVSIIGSLVRDEETEVRLPGSARHNTFWPVWPITVCKLHSTAWQQDIDLRQFSEKKYKTNQNYLARWRIQLYYYVSLQLPALRTLLAPLDCYKQILAAVKCNTAMVYYFHLLCCLVCADLRGSLGCQKMLKPKSFIKAGIVDNEQQYDIRWNQSHIYAGGLWGPGRKCECWGRKHQLWSKFRHTHLFSE